MKQLPPRSGRLLELITRIAPIPLSITLLCGVVSFVKNEGLWHAYLIPFIVWSILSLTQMWVKQYPEKASYREQCFLFALVWILCAAISALPFLFVQQTVDFPDYSSAFFEAMSGYTSAGLTMVSDPSKLPASIQLYRSVMQWVGGLGFALFAMTAINSADSIDSMLEASGLSKSDRFNGQRLIKAYLYTYIALTIFILVGLVLYSIPVWEAINHSLTMASTGGFTITANSLSSYSGHTLTFVSICLFLSALPFPVMYLVSHGKWRIARKNTQMKVFTFCVLLALSLGMLATTSFSSKLFNIVSAATTAGFSVGQPTSIHPAITTILVVLMIVGGASASTAGGIKINRLVWLLKGVKAYLQNKQTQYFFNKELVVKSKAYKNIRIAGLYLLCSLSIRLLGTLAILLLEPMSKSSDVLFEAASAITTGFAGNDIHWGSKWILSILMWIGRLEYQTISLFLIVAFLKMSVHRKQ